MNVGITKVCSDCRRELSADCFYKSGTSKLGLHPRCKDCHRSRNAQNRIQNRDHYRDYDRQRSLTAKRKAQFKSTRDGINADAERSAKHLAAKARWVQHNGAKRAAQVAVNNAVRDGRLSVLPCQNCGTAERPHAHHEDYSKPLEVVWLCKSCHGARHREINAERRAARKAAA